jgi:DNA mismatch repair protein MutS2
MERRSLAVGDRVRRAGASTVGTVREVRDDGTVAVEFGSVRMVLSSGLVEPVDGPAPSAHPPIRPSAAPPIDVAAPSEISLRGMRIDEAETEFLRALDAAVLADLPYLRIIHGKGTGALREMVHALLGRDPRVARFAFAPPNQGGQGVTVAEFRS